MTENQHSEKAPNAKVVSLTFQAEAVRAFTAGIQETAFATFAVTIAVKHFSSGPAIKATLIGSLAIGLLCGVFILPSIAKLRWRPSRAAALIQMLSMFGFLIAAFSGDNEGVYLVGMCIGMGVISMAIPLQTHYLRENFPSDSRGRLFSVSIFIRALSAMLFSWLISVYLDRDFGNFPHVLMLFAVASGIAAVCQFVIPSRPFANEVKRDPVENSIRLFQNDKVFGRMIVVAMAMGLGVLGSNALRVDYLVNPDHPLQFDVPTVALITGIIPSITRLVSTFFWGWLFDHMDFFKLRAIVNAVFFSGILLYFISGDLVLIGIGSALFGLARGGGEILWNLWVTKLGNPSEIASYMSVHTFMTGLRVAVAPFLGLYLVKYSNIPTMVVVSSLFVILSFVLLWPLLKSKSGDRVDL